jgi:hypothetical protein
MRLSWTLSRK